MQLEAQQGQPLDADLRDSFARQLALCDVLEEIADSLPYGLNHQRCLRAAQLIGPVLRRAHAAEEAVLFPRILAAHANGTTVVEQLRLEHLEDECFAEEVQYELQLLGCRQPVLAPEATGYMLRGFFECLRRHVRHEHELLVGLRVN
jgi:hemerythrin-like domain-containing protein